MRETPLPPEREDASEQVFAAGAQEQFRAHALFLQALQLAFERHGAQPRKGTPVPYVSHLLQVAGLVLENGGDWEQAAAALLHDVIEDQGVPDALLLRAFGPRVARIVRECTDTAPGDTPEEKSPWLERKLAFLERLAQAGDDSVLVVACDKRHNLGAMIADYGVEGAPVFERFNAPSDQQLRVYREFVRVAGPRLPARLRLELEQLVVQLEAIVLSKYPVSQPGEA